MSIKQQNLLIRRLIEEEIDRLFEQEAPATGTDKPDANADAASGDDTATADLGADATSDSGADAGGDLNLGGAGGGGGGADLGDLGDATGDDATGEDSDVSMDTGGGSFGGFGGKKSFDFGSDGSSGLVPDDDSDSENGENTGDEKDTATTVGPEDVEIPQDPVLATVDEAIKMLDTTQIPGNILKNVKYSIQKYFNSFDDATPVIKALWDTEDLVLRDVAKRLLIFMRGN